MSGGGPGLADDEDLTQVIAPGGAARRLDPTAAAYHRQPADRGRRDRAAAGRGDLPSRRRARPVAGAVLVAVGLLLLVAGLYGGWRAVRGDSRPVPPRTPATSTIPRGAAAPDQPVGWNLRT